MSKDFFKDIMMLMESIEDSSVMEYDDEEYTDYPSWVETNRERFIDDPFAVYEVDTMLDTYPKIYNLLKEAMVEFYYEFNYRPLALKRWVDAVERFHDDSLTHLDNIEQYITLSSGYLHDFVEFVLAFPEDKKNTHLKCTKLQKVLFASVEKWPKVINAYVEETGNDYPEI